MSNEQGVLQVEQAADAPAQTGASAPGQRVAPIESRFLFVNIAAQRAKQLRRGALPRLPSLRPDPQTGARPANTHKLERIAMDEVDGGLIVYDLPEPKSAPVREAP